VFGTGCFLCQFSGWSAPVGRRGTDSLGHWAQRKPMRETANIGRCPVQPKLFPAQSLSQRRASEPDPIKSPDIGRDYYVDFEAGVLQANRRVSGLDEQPVSSLNCTTKFELKNDAAAGNAIKIDAPPHPPQKNNRIELVRARIAEGSTRAPFSQNVD